MKGADAVNARDLLDFEFTHDDIGYPTTVREFFRQLLTTLWDEEDGFSGKRPWGNSGWKLDLAAELIRQGHLRGQLDDDHYIEDYDRGTFHDLVMEAIRYL